MKWRTVGWVCMLTMLTAFLLVGQEKRSSEDSGTRSVQGIVTDASGKPVANAVVQLKDTKSLQIRSFITDAGGAYHFAGLSSNVVYELKAVYEGRASSSKT